MSAPAKKRAVQPRESDGNGSDGQEDNVDQMVVNNIQYNNIIALKTIVSNF